VVTQEEFDALVARVAAIETAAVATTAAIEGYRAPGELCTTDHPHGSPYLRYSEGTYSCACGQVYMADGMGGLMLENSEES